MGILKNITESLNNRKYAKLKKKYIEEFEKDGYFGDITKIQEYISKKNIPVISKPEKYGDRYDVIEEIFSDNPNVLSHIKQNRAEALLAIPPILSSRIMTEHLPEGKTELESNAYNEFQSKIFKFDDYYSGDKQVNINGNQNDLLQDASRVYRVVEQMCKGDVNKAMMLSDFGFNNRNYIKAYALKSLDGTNEISEKQNIIMETQSILDDISKDDSFAETAKKFGSESTKAFFERIESIAKLQELGIDCSIEDMSISYIDASNEEKNKAFKRELSTIKKDMKPEDFDVSNFAMVRTTEFFPKNREMEVIDELSAREHVSNFLSSRFFTQDMIKEFGEKWYDTEGLYSKGSKNSEKRKEIEEKYDILSPMYRSTKHFTLNGLVSSHEYGDFSGNPYIVIDPLEEHIDDDNILSINEADTYFEISREKPMKLSKKAELMMPLEEYLKIKDDPEMLKQIHEYNLTLFSGDEKIAVDMKLKEMGYIPEDIGKWGYELGCVMDKAIDNLSKSRGIDISVHFYSDIKEKDQEKTNEMTSHSNKLFVDSVFESFGIDEKYREGALNQSLTDEELDEIISTCGEDNLKAFITKFNEDRRKELDKKREEFFASRENGEKEAIE